MKILFLLLIIISQQGKTCSCIRHSPLDPLARSDFMATVKVLDVSADPQNKHYAVDVVTARDAPVKATADGTVIFAEWTAETGFVMIIEHRDNLISVYKHNASLAKEQGELVKAGEVIATAGNTGELSTGPHLHFELWSEGYPINPTNFIDFD